MRFHNKVYMDVIDRFVIIIYDQTSTCTDVTRPRRSSLQIYSLYAEKPTNMCCSEAVCQVSCLPR